MSRTYLQQEFPLSIFPLFVVSLHTYILAAAIGNKGLQLEDRELLERPEQDRNYIHGDAHSPYFPSALALRCRRFRLPRNFEIHMESHSQ